ncbi:MULTISPECIES: 3D domain-containing protein [unclassified Brevundimonas]|uniref:3D domain-containing protein n=1 Tax=unclassified Brevundimonas TaxID=2622653 RepID=UPI001ADE3674|nr:MULTISPECIES: 3D domain-containing protein [unclassified Brevundimonas]
MLGTAAAFAMAFAMALSDPNAAGVDQPGPVSYDAVLAAEAAAIEANATAEGSREANLSAEQIEMMASEPDWRASARLYHAGGGGATGNDSLGCRPIAMRTVAVDPKVIPRRTRLFIRETVGLRMADGSLHDGYWYASDTGGAIKGQKIDLYTGHGRGSMQPAMRLNMRTLTIHDAGDFDGCPPAWESASN